MFLIGQNDLAEHFGVRDRVAPMRKWWNTAFASVAEQKAQNPSAAQPLIALQLAGEAAWTGRHYGALSRQGYQKNAIAYRCVRMIAEAAASIPLCVRRDERCENVDAVTRFLSRGQGGASQTEIFERFYGYLQLSGNAYLEAGLVDNQPMAIYALRPDSVRCVTDRKGWTQGWDYNVEGTIKRYRIDPATGRAPLFHLSLFNPLDETTGYAPMAAAAQAIDIHNAGGRWTKALLDNAARPSGALIYKGVNGAERLSDEQFTRLKTELEGAHSGANNAGRPMVLEGGLDWKAMSFSPADMDFIAARREAAREIALAFGVPPMLLGIPGDNSYANYKEANLAFWRQTIIPLVTKTAKGLEQWIRPYFGDDISLLPDLDQLSALSEERALLWQRLGQADFISDAERRELAGLGAEIEEVSHGR